MSVLRSWYDLGTDVLILRLVAVGAAAGVAAWGLAMALHLVLGTGRPSLSSLLWAIPRGMLFGAIMGTGFAIYWSR